VALNGHVFGFNSFDQSDSRGDFVCVDWASGNVEWRQKNPGRGMVIAAGGKLLILSRGGELILAEANPKAYTEISRAQIVGGTCRTDPAIANGHIFVRSVNGELVCLSVE
jgi:outer membrane protein assembly factor BamB